jgi:metallophosphoesterase (TIGR03767 family)
LTRSTRDAVGAWAATTTLDRTLVGGAVKGQGAERAYRALEVAAGEPHRVRLELAGRQPQPTRRTSLVHLVHLTDTQIVDVRSPARIEFIERRSERVALARLLPAHRAHESLSLHALDATLRTMRALPPSAITGEPVELAVTTGDAVDNQQSNELAWFLSAMRGDDVTPSSRSDGFDGVQSTAWDDASYWHPDGGDDVYAMRWGFPSYPGLLRDAARAFRSTGVGLPWLACFGNHEALVQGIALPTEAVRSIATGELKAADVPDGFSLDGSVETFVATPEAFLNGPSRAIPADPSRALFTRRDFVRAHLDAAGSPRGHGFTDENLRDGTAYYAYDGVPGVRMIVLDTSNPGGFAEGSIGARQAAWLEERLDEVHPRSIDQAGHSVTRNAEDRLVVLFSHHGLETMTNASTEENPFDPDGRDVPRLLAQDVRAILHRFGNVVLWVNGHTHEHRIHPRRDPSGRTPGFWEVSTGAVMDWPSQARLIELIDNGDGTLSIVCTLVDHAGAPDPADAEDPWRLASIHRELAANDPERGLTWHAAGGPDDRNVELVVPSLGQSSR